jgi:hypothetical protein
VPLILFAGYHNESVVFSMIFFAVMILAYTLIINHLTVKSGSVWPSVLIHGSHNLFMALVFDKMTTNSGITKYITTEFGVGLAVVYSIVAIYILRKYHSPELKRVIN